MGGQGCVRFGLWALQARPRATKLGWLDYAGLLPMLGLRAHKGVGCETLLWCACVRQRTGYAIPMHRLVHAGQVGWLVYACSQAMCAADAWCSWVQTEVEVATIVRVPIVLGSMGHVLICVGTICCADRGLPMCRLREPTPIPFLGFSLHWDLWVEFFFGY